MDDTLRCPGCQARLNLPALPEEQRVQCPRCRHVFAPTAKRPNASPAAPAAAKVHQPIDEQEEAILHRRLCRTQPLQGEWKAILAMVLLGFSILSYVVQLYVNFEKVQLLQMEVDLLFGGRFAARNGRPVEFERRWLNLERRLPIAQFLHHATFWPAMIGFLMWVAQTSRNAHLLQAEGITHTPGSAVISFFIPLINLFQPYLILQELWKASDPKVNVRMHSWANTPSSAMIRCWWGALVAAGILIAFGSVSSLQHLNDREELTTAWMHCLANVCTIVAGVLLICIIKALTQRQTERYIRLYEDPA